MKKTKERIPTHASGDHVVHLLAISYTSSKTPVTMASFGRGCIVQAGMSGPFAVNAQQLAVDEVDLALRLTSRGSVFPDTECDGPASH